MSRFCTVPIGLKPAYLHARIQPLVYIPAKLITYRYIRHKYVTGTECDERIIIGELPTFPIEKGIATAGLLSSIAVDKYVYHLPLYLQVERFKRDQVPIASSTIDSWIAQVANLLVSIYEYFKYKVRNQGYLQVDETPIKVLDRGKKGKTHQGYYWVYNSPLQDAVVFDYRQGRVRDGPRQLLKDFTGYLPTDGYNVYELPQPSPDPDYHISTPEGARRLYEKLNE